MLHLQRIIDPNTSLPVLTEAAPALWEQVFSEIKERVITGQMASLAELRQEQLQSLLRWSQTQNTPLSDSHHARESAMRARMTVLAIDQFSDAMVGKIGAKASLKDRVIFSSTVGRAMIQKKLLSCQQFDRSWKWIDDKAWAAGQIQQWGNWLVPTTEFIDRIKEHAGGRTILELGAGHGYCAKALQERGANIQAIDDFSWQTNDSSMTSSDATTRVKKMDAIQALNEFKPSVVFCSWPPPNNSFERKIFMTPSVQLYMAVVSSHRFASGDWKAYQQQSAFACSTTESLNKLLRPHESEQQVLIFRRKS